MNMNMLMMKKSKGRNISRTSASLPSMTVIGSAKPDVLRIKVYKPSNNEEDPGYEPGASKKLCIDPRLASYRTIQCLIAQAFDLKTEFTITAVQKCPATGLEKFTAIWSDWDLEAAIRNVNSGSYLRLRYELTNREDGLDDWDFVALNDSNSNIRWFNVDNRSIIATVNPTQKKKSSTLKKTINIICGGNLRNSGKPIGTDDLKKFLDEEGRLEHPNDLRQAIYEGGIEPSARNTVWRHLLNIFPINMTNIERKEYLQQVSIEYEKLKGRWKNVLCYTEKTRAIMRAIKTDVVRTDRTFSFYATSDDKNVNLQALYRILVTYCVSHPKIPYCQGMNEYASTLLYVMRDESLAYLCFCSIMRRIQANFSTNGVAIATKFNHLKILLQAVDPVYWHFLETYDAVNLYFTYRWLLLECKREFPFEQSLRVLEVMWATLPINNEIPELHEENLLPIIPDKDSIDDSCFVSSQLSHRALSCPDLSVINESPSRKNRQHSYSVTEHNDYNILSFKSSIMHRDYNVPSSRSSSIHHDCTMTSSKTSRSSSARHDFYSTLESDENQLDSSIKYNHYFATASTKSKESTFENSYSLSEISEFDSENLSTVSNNNNNNNLKINSTASEVSSSSDWLLRLPANDRIWLEDDNSFLLFLCIAILLAHRTQLLKRKNLDQQEISIYFDQYRRRHNAERLLKYARSLYGQYIQWARKKRMVDDLDNFSAS